MGVKTEEGQLAAKVLDDYMKDFQQRNPTLRYFRLIFIWTKQRRIFILILFRL